MACCGGIFYGLPTVCLIAIGSLHIFAGIKHLRYAGRIVGWVSALLAIMSAFGCGCTPLGMAVGVLGIIVYVDPDVREALTLGDEGMPIGEILKRVGKQTNR